MARTRIFFLDNLRVFLTALVLSHHIAITYGGGGDWSYKEPTTDLTTTILLSIFTAFNQSYFMGLFFFIAGYFTPGSCDRKGPGCFLRDRFKRLGIPLLLYATIVNPVVAYQYYIRETGGQLPYLEFWKESITNPEHLGVGPLWFVEALLIFALAYALWHALRKPSRGAVVHEQRVPGNKQVIIFALILGVVTATVRMWYPTGKEFLQFQLGFFPQYIALYVVGIIAYRRNWLANTPTHVVKVSRVIAIAAIPLMLAIAIVGGALEGNSSAFNGGMHWQMFVYAMWEMFVGIAMCIVVLTWFQKRFNQQGEFARTLSANAYTAYIVQAPTLVYLSLALSGLHIYPLAKFALVVLIGVPLCFSVSHFLVRRLPYAKAIL